MITAAAVAAGLDTPTLCELAGWHRNADARDIRDAFEQALSESGIGLPDRGLARRHALRRMAARLIDYTLGLDQQTWAAQLRIAALALTSSPPIGPGC
jgi:hypothetical protein